MDTKQSVVDRQGNVLSVGDSVILMHGKNTGQVHEILSIDEYFTARDGYLLHLSGRDLGFLSHRVLKQTPKKKWPTVPSVKSVEEKALDIFPLRFMRKNDRITFRIHDVCNTYIEVSVLTSTRTEFLRDERWRIDSRITPAFYQNWIKMGSRALQIGALVRVTLHNEVPRSRHYDVEYMGVHTDD